MTGSNGTVRVVLPAHLRTIAKVEGEVRVEIDGAVTQQSVLDAVEERYPKLVGHHPRPRHPQETCVRPVLRLRAGPLARAARRTAPGAGRAR